MRIKDKIAMNSTKEAIQIADEKVSLMKHTKSKCSDYYDFIDANV